MQLRKATGTKEYRGFNIQYAKLDDEEVKSLEGTDVWDEVQRLDTVWEAVVMIEGEDKCFYDDSRGLVLTKAKDAIDRHLSAAS